VQQKGLLWQPHRQSLSKITDEAIQGSAAWLTKRMDAAQRDRASAIRSQHPEEAAPKILREIGAGA